ncbi:MAG: SLC13 family permease [Candidatus Omnitrophica bacterium]|nr:SLC13 family permease [Candidatus Omnitrophota bacterium]
MNRPLIKGAVLFIFSILLGWFTYSLGFSSQQAISIGIFSLSILGTLFFWDFRLSFAFLGTSILLFTKTIDLDNLVKFASLEIIIFLIGMMVLVGLLKESGFFAWLVSLILRMRNLTAKRFVIYIVVISALLSCAVDEVTSIIFMVAAVLEICDYFEVEPVPFVIVSIIATNIGSSGTVLGNPIGILIAAKSGLTFEDFILKAFPLMLVCLFVTLIIFLIAYRNPIKKLERQIKEMGANEMLIRLISVPPEKELKISLFIFGITLFFIALHHRLEIFLGLENNTILLITPLISAGAVMIWKYRRARIFIEKDVEWWTLLFFLLLFAQAGTLKYTGFTDVLAKKMILVVKHTHGYLIGLVLWIATFGSSMLDNVVLVASFIPIIQSLEGLGFILKPLWWALLFGGCFGGNITLIGSTANIVALGILEKERKIKVSFFKWLKIGLIVGLFTTFLVWLALIWLPLYR